MQVLPDGPSGFSPGLVTPNWETQVLATGAADSPLPWAADLLGPEWQLWPPWPKGLKTEGNENVSGSHFSLTSVIGWGPAI